MSFADALARLGGSRALAIGQAPRRILHVPLGASSVDVWETDGDPADDLLRRDFTVNALGLAFPGGRLVAPDGALDDLVARRLRLPRAGVLLEDPLRVVRAARFLARLPGFRLDPAALPELRRAARRLGNVAPERRLSELDAILAAGPALRRPRPRPARGVGSARSAPARYPAGRAAPRHSPRRRGRCGRVRSPSADAPSLTRRPRSRRRRARSAPREPARPPARGDAPRPSRGRRAHPAGATRFSSCADRHRSPARPSPSSPSARGAAGRAIALEAQRLLAVRGALAPTPAAPASRRCRGRGPASWACRGAPWASRSPASTKRSPRETSGGAERPGRSSLGTGSAARRRAGSVSRSV